MSDPSDTRPDGNDTRVSDRKSLRLQGAIFWTVCGLVIAVYAYIAHAGFLKPLSLNTPDNYYNLLVEGFRSGQLGVKKEVPIGFAQLSDPYDSAANAPYRSEPYKMHDLSYFKGRLYLYFGVSPTLLLFWPFAALTGHYLFPRQAVPIFCAIGFLASAVLLRALWRRYFAMVSAGVVTACALALGLATGMPVLLSRSEIYEVPISCGYMLTMLAVAAIWCALHEAKRQGWCLVAASVAYGLAVGARPNLLFGAVILLVPVVIAWIERKPISTLLVAAMGPILLIGLGLMLYNAMRFESPFEFGLRYQLAAARQDTMRFFNVDYVWFNFRVFFLEPARWDGRFPFVHEIAVPFLPPGRGPIEAPVGVLTTIPLVWFALAVPLAWRGRPASERLTLRRFATVVALVFGVCAIFICLFRGTNFRYEVEFLPPLLLLAVLGILGLERVLADQPVCHRVARCGWGLLLGFSVAFNLLAGVDNYAKADCHIGNALSHAGQFREAVGHYERALRLKPDFVEAHYNLGDALLQLGRPQEAINHCEQALRIKPDSAEAHNNLGAALERTGRAQEAITQYEEALRINPDFSEAHNNLGVARERAGQIQEAIGQYEQALRIKPDFAEAHYNLGSALGRAGRPQEAIGHFEQALRIKPNSAEAHNNLGIALERAGQIQKAIGEYEQAVRIKPDFPEAHYNLGDAYEQVSRVQEAIGQFEQALRIKPDFAEAQNKLTRLRAAR